MTYLSAWTHQPEERGAIRLLALWLLLEGSDQAFSKGWTRSWGGGASFGAAPRPPPPAWKSWTETIESVRSVNYALS
jgi:hypothetical protein